MLRSIAISVATVLCPLALCVSGCGGGEAEAPADAAAQASGLGSSQETPQAAIVREFLEAVQQGDRDAASGRLTAKAVAAFKEHEVPFLPTAITSGSFQLGKTVQSGNTHFVQCVWTDHEAGAGSEKIQWMVKEEGGSGWRIYGLAVFIEEKGDNLVINFEQPEALLPGSRGPQQVDAEAGAATAPAQQAAMPQDPFQSAPR